MKAVVQRVLSSSVAIDGKIINEIGQGYMVLFGVAQGDSQEDADYLAGKIARLRVFEDENGKMNKSITDVNGEILAISQFTLCADCKKGNRPSFINAEEPVRANRMYEYFMVKLKENGVRNVKSGVFGGDMKVSLVNDGPVTIVYDTKEK